MVHNHYFSVAAFLATILAGSVEAGLHLREAKAVAADTEKDHGLEFSWDKSLEMIVEKGGKCKAGGKEGKGFRRECEGGFKKMATFETSAQDLTQDLASDVSDMLTDMMPKEESLRPTKEAMDEIASWDNDYDIVDLFVDEDCSEESGCNKTVEFGGYVKMFWGCNVTFSKTDDGKMSKEVACGAKSSEGMGKKPDMHHHHGDIGKKKFHTKHHSHVHD